MGGRGYDQAMAVVLGTTTWAHRLLHSASGGRLGRRFPGGAVVVWLSLPGRRSGVDRTVPLLAVREHDQPGSPWLVAGSNAGQSRVPAWVLNARAVKHGHLEVDGQTLPVAVSEITDDGERARGYARLTGVWHWFDGYARRTSDVRQIPVFRLIPEDTETSTTS
ncbi:MAG: nitroreductase/quinone reductase family protein [Actinomycetes bacterium]